MARKIFLAILLIVIIALASQKVFLKTRDLSSSTAQVQTINGQEFDKIAEEGAFILDVHTPEQRHIPGTDAFIPYTDISSHLDELPRDKDQSILVYCRSGSMSKAASKELVELGYKNVYDLDGGINAYRESHVEVTLTPSTHAFGTVIYGEVPRTNFILTNSTPNTLKITKVSGSCACTQPSALKTELEPYESTEIEVDFDPSVHKDDNDLGDITRTIFVETDNPNFPKLSTTITATVIRE